MRSAGRRAPRPARAKLRDVHFGQLPHAMPLTVASGYASLTGRRERNEDYVGLVAAEGAELIAKGMLLAVADGVSGSAGGREAAECTVRGLLADYYATPDTWNIPL